MTTVIEELTIDPSHMHTSEGHADLLSDPFFVGPESQRLEIVASAQREDRSLAVEISQDDEAGQWIAWAPEILEYGAGETPRQAFADLMDNIHSLREVLRARRFALSEAMVHRLALIEHALPQSQ